MPTTSSIQFFDGFRWAFLPPRTGRRAVSYYGRWPSPSQGRSILLRAKELLPLVGFLEACATLQLIQEFREQPGVLTHFASGKLVEHRPDFLFSSDGIAHLIFIPTRAGMPFASPDRQLVAHGDEGVCHFRVCAFSPTKPSIIELSTLSPSHLIRGPLSGAQLSVVRSVYDELIGGAEMRRHRFV
ncbi:hypothetical protein [Cupriavidus sp. H18C2]|uniref:hypothetical protein n=1 Tax=Cupriavidus sp. H18C2 TaxID=3241602 RepID=UPI003BF839C5